MWTIVDTRNLKSVKAARRKFDSGTHDCMWFRDAKGVLRWHIRKRKKIINRRPYFVRFVRNDDNTTKVVPMY